MLVHEANDLFGARRFVRITTKPIVNVMVNAHSTSTIVVVEHIAERVSARCRNRGEVSGLVQRTDEEANRWRRAAIKSFFFLPETACWRFPINRDSKQPAGANECRHMLKRAPHRAGVMENSPTVHDVIGSSWQVEQTPGMHGPVLSNIELREKLACGFNAVWIYVDPVHLAGAQSQTAAIDKPEPQPTSRIRAPRMSPFGNSLINPC